MQRETNLDGWNCSCSCGCSKELLLLLLLLPMLAFWLKLPIMEDLHFLVLGHLWNAVCFIIACGILLLITLLLAAFRLVEWTFTALASVCSAIARFAYHVMQRLHNLTDAVGEIFGQFVWDDGDD